MDLDFSKQSGITVKMPNQTYTVRKPNLAEIKKLEKDQKKSKDGWGPVTEMLSGLGFPSDELEKLNTDQLDALTQALMPEKKRA